MMRVLLPAVFTAVCSVSASAAVLSGGTRVVIAPDAPESVRIAAGEATNFLSRVLGAPMAITVEPDPRGGNVILGVNVWTKGAGLSPEKLPRDGFEIVSDVKNIYIAGIDSTERNPERICKLRGEMLWGPQFERGTQFGVYEFLERFAGCRFYFPGEFGEIVPRHERLEVPEGRWSRSPDWTTRRYGYSDGKPPEELLRQFGGDLNAVKRMNYYRLRMETRYLPCCHGLLRFRMLDRFGKEHPEYFVMTADGKRQTVPGPAAKYLAGAFCYSSAVTNEVYEDIKAYLSGLPPQTRGFPGKEWPWAFHPGKVIDIMPQDGLPLCHCDRCQASYKAAKNPEYPATELVWGFTSALAKRLEADGFKDFTLTQMAYSQYRDTPDFDLSDHVQVMVAEYGPYGLNSANRAKQDAEIAAWTRKLGRKVWIWTYPGKCGRLNIPGVPDMCPKAWGAYFKDNAPNVFGAFTESEVDNWLFHYLNYYVFAKVGWDNKTDVDSLLDEHHRLMFGPAAPEMKRFYESLEEKWIGSVAGKETTTPLGPEVTPPPDRVLWGEVYSESALADYRALFAAAERKCVAGSPESRRLAFIRQEFLGSLEKAASAYHAKLKAMDAAGWNPSMPPMELKPFPFAHHAPAEECPSRVSCVRRDGQLVITADFAEPYMANAPAEKREHDAPSIFTDNVLEIVLNPSGDRQTIYHLVVNAAGSLYDGKAVRLGKARPRNDVSWDSGADVKVERRADGWKAVVSIPLASFGEEVKATFPANFGRDRQVIGNDAASGFYKWSPFANDYREVENFSCITP